MDETSEPEPQEAIAEDVVPGEEPAPKVVSRTVFIVSVIAAILIAGAAGVVIGWKIEQQRVKDDLANIRPIGTVTAVDEDSVTIELQTASGSKTYVINDATNVDGSGEMVEGSTVLIRSWRSQGGELLARKIVVLPDAAAPAEQSSDG